ncbi:MAG: ABC transporter ATP-binding protein [Gemmatimonadota bacterium]
MPAPVIETRDLTKHYGDTRAVEGLDVTVEEGQVFGFLGPNGSGKTTTIGMLLGIVTPTRGSFRLLGADGRGELSDVRRRVGATLEQPNFYPYLSCRDNLAIVARVKDAPAARIDEALETVGLLERGSTKFDACSLGMKQRLALAATMLGDPDLLILDEPANGLDPEGMRAIRDILLALAHRGKTIFLSSHLLWEVERTCTHVAILRHGRVVRTAAVEEITKGGAALAALGADDLTALETTLADYPAAGSIEREAGFVLAEVTDGDLAALNRWLAGRGIHLSHLSLKRRTLEDAFLESTTDPGAGPSTRISDRSKHHPTPGSPDGVSA